jgi:hypothetical protein
MPAAKLDLYKKHKAEYAAKKKPALFDIKPVQYLAIDGRGAPGDAEFQTKVAAMYNVAFTIKMASKAAGRDYTVCKLEALWWSDEGHDLSRIPMEKWKWKLLMRTPDFIGKAQLDAARKDIASKDKAPAAREVNLETLDEGQCVQALHVGPYSEVAGTINAMHSFVLEKDLALRGRHHEIYLSDPRRTAPGKLKTILRQPVG